VAALGFEWMPGFGKAAMGPDVAIFKKGSHAAAYALARMDAEAAELQKSQQRRRGEPPLIAGLQAQAQAAAQQAHAQAQAPYGQPQQGQRAGGGGGGAGGGASSGAGSGRASGLANAGRKIAGGGYSGGGNGTLSTSPMRGREGGHAGGHAGGREGGHAGGHGGGRDADADSLPDLSKTARKMATVLGRKGWPAAAAEMHKRAERDVQRGLALGGGQPGAPSLWASNAGGAAGAPRPGAAAISADVMRDTLAKHGVPLTGREAAQLAAKYADKAGSIDLARLARDAGLA
jgi:hypothetical protein